MAKDGGYKKNLHGAVGRGDVLMFRPEDLQVITDKAHPQYDPRVELPVNEALVLSIMEHGVITALAITRDGEDVYVNDGRQRRAAALEANKRLRKEGRPEVQMPCVWKRGDDAHLFELSIASNEIRTADSPMAKAKKMQRLAELGRSEQQISIAFGVTPKTVKNHLALIECAPQVQKAVESGQLPATAAKVLSVLPKTEQKDALDKMVAAGATKGRNAEKAVKASKEKRGIEVTVRMRSRALLERLQRELLVDMNESSAALIAWVLGDEKAFERHPLLGNAATRAEGASSMSKGNGAGKGTGNPEANTAQA